MRIEPIISFRDKDYFLSNYFPRKFIWRGIEFDTGEQSFSYAKTFHVPVARQQVFRDNILAAKTPADAKKLGRACPIDVEEWNKRRVVYMREIIHSKFSCNPDLVGALINTGAAPLVEGNDWGDTFWGKCRVDGKVVGLNMLGTILMEERGAWLRDRESCPLH
jgi:ribA/ribD-fused uncharacterized protein